MNWETKAKSLKLNAGTCKGLPLNAEVFFLILLSAKGPFLSGLFGRQNELYFEMFFLITLTSCHQSRLPTWKLIAQAESTIRGNFGTREKSRRLNLLTQPAMSWHFYSHSPTPLKLYLCQIMLLSHWPTFSFSEAPNAFKLQGSHSCFHFPRTLSSGFSNVVHPVVLDTIIIFLYRWWNRHQGD